MYPIVAAGINSCDTCALVNVGAGTGYAGWTKGSTNLAVTTSDSWGSIMGFGQQNWIDVGMMVGGLQIVDCPNHDCAAVDYSTCSVTTPCNFTVNVPWSQTCVNNNTRHCHYGVLQLSQINTADYSYNTRVGNFAHTNGMSTGYCQGYPCGQTGNMTWMGYGGPYLNTNLHDNYIDTCNYRTGGTPGPGTIGAPTFACDASKIPTPSGWIEAFGTASGTVSVNGNNNVEMKTGACIEVYPQGQSPALPRAPEARGGNVGQCRGGETPEARGRP